MTQPSFAEAAQAGAIAARANKVCLELTKDEYAVICTALELYSTAAGYLSSSLNFRRGVASLMAKLAEQSTQRN